MILELFILLQIVAVLAFGLAFFNKNEILWVINIALSGVMMVVSYTIEYPVYLYNSTLGAYEPTTIIYSYPYLMGINMLLFGLGILLFFFDIFEKYRDSANVNDDINK